MNNKVVNRYTRGFLLVLSLLAYSHGQGTGELLWPDGKAGRAGDSANFRPTLLSYPATGSNANGAAVVICPGGAYAFLAWEYEGVDVARKMNSYGISAFVVKYRHAPGFKYPDPIDDGRRAIRMVRSRAKRLGIDTSRIGILGFSAGGHLASTVATHFDAGNRTSPDSIEWHSSRPAFNILIYPVVTMTTPYTHGQSRTNLIGNPPSADMINLLSNEKQVNASTPPSFLVHTRDDGAVPYQNSQMFYDSCLKAGVKAKFILYPNGPHGFGLANGMNGVPNLPALAGWPDSCRKWLDGLGFLTPAPSSKFSLNEDGRQGKRRASLPGGKAQILFWINDNRHDAAGRVLKIPEQTVNGP